jgi:uncharacterized protein (DUF1697 family)
MVEYVSLLRGINVGGRSIKMNDLKDVYSSQGLTAIKTYLQSGNVVFESNEANETEIRNKLENAVSSKFNYHAKIFVLKKEKLKVILNSIPFELTSGSHCYVIFLDNGLEVNLFEQSRSVVSDIDEIFLGKGVLYWKVKKGMTVKSPFSKMLVKKEFKNSHTNRNLNTLYKLLA